jgi:RNA polymerase sigma factor (sigma-70 family)
MAASPLTKVVQHLRRAALLRDGGDLSDGQLLECYLRDHEDAAFGALVHRHGPMVWGVCRRLLSCHHDAEDAFQATFVVLVRKAASIVPRQMVANWLYGVAYQTALKARAAAARRRTRERQVSDMPEPAVEEDLWRDLQPILDRELNRLPDKYRVPVVLCDLEGKTHKQAASLLGCPEGTLSARVSRARAMLARRLARHGMALSAGSLAAVLTQNAASACVPTAVLSGTIKAMLSIAAGQAAATGVVSAGAAVLAEGVVKTMLLSKLKSLAVLLVAAGGIVYGVGTLRNVLATERQDANALREVGSSPANPGFGVVQEAQPKKTDAERIVGTWRVSQLRVNGQEQSSEAVLLRFTFSKDGTLLMTIATEAAKKGTYKISSPSPGQVEQFLKLKAKTDRPGKIDLKLLEDQRGDSMLGIYKFSGNNQLSLCLSADHNGKRPTEFNGDKDSQQVLIVLDRAKPGEEKPTEEEIAKNRAVIDKVREAAARTMTLNNLSQVGKLMHLYHDKKRTFPTHAIYSADGKTPLLSWRVAILPYTDAAGLYEEFNLDEPWDSAPNKKLIAKMPAFFHSPAGAKRDDGLTHFQVFTGPDTLFDGLKRITLLGIADGVSNTILAIESKEPVIWTKPADLTLPQKGTEDALKTVESRLDAAKANSLVASDRLQQFTALAKQGAMSKALVDDAAAGVAASRAALAQIEEEKRALLGLPSVVGLYKDGVAVLLCDGSVRMVPSNLDPGIWRALITPNGGETVDLFNAKK